MIENIEGWETGLYKGEPYISGEQPLISNLIKLNSNENPYSPAPEVIEAIMSFDATSLRFYPKSDGSPLKEKLAESYGLNNNQIFVGNGSDEVLALSFRACFGTAKPILFPDITYSFYPVWCDFLNIPYVTKELGDDFTIDKEDYNEANGGIVIANPNAPTSIGVDLDFIETIMNYNSNSVVIVDEAYADFSDVSAHKLIDKYPNLLVIRTMSKSKSLAGLRIGYALGSEKIIKALQMAKDSFNSYPIDSIAITAGVAAMDAEDYYNEITNKIIATRQYTSEALSSLGFNVLPSKTNFLFVGCKDGEAKPLFDFLRNKGILIRYFAKPRLENHLRISIGKDDEMIKLIDAVKEFLL